MNVLHVIETLDPAAGGPPVVAARLAAAQAKLGHAVTILAAEVAAADKLGGLVGVRVVPGPTVTRWQAVVGRRAVDDMLPVVRGHDVVHLHGVWDPLLFAAARAARAAGRPYLVTPHGMLDPWSLAQRRWKKRLALALGWRAMLDRAAALHLLNADEQALAAGLGIKAAGVVIPNGVDLDEFDPPPRPELFRRRLPALGDRPYVLFLSRLHYKKGLDYLADAFRILAADRADVHLVVAGPDDGARADFERRVAAAGLADRVHLPGPVYGPEKLSAVAGAACFCLPSRQEGFSVAILEALACGTPAVVSTACHFPEVAEAGAGEVVPLDAAAVATALGRVLADPALRERMGRAGRELVAARFTWPRIAARSVETYAGLAAAAGEGATA
ncbi:MAG TPA: glycosyltransferase [Gemmataceae bacterium]|jgi:glycosyltransferase involved in cell wall biosynthesis